LALPSPLGYQLFTAWSASRWATRAQLKQGCRAALWHFSSFDGDCYVFSLDTTRTVSDIERTPQVGLTFTGKPGFLGKPPIFIAIEGKAELIRDKAVFEQHWMKDLELWFEQGVDTAGLVLIRVHADRLHYWDGEDEGEWVS
jgi:general stress protein 26